MITKIYSNPLLAQNARISTRIGFVPRTLNVAPGKIIPDSGQKPGLNRKISKKTTELQNKKGPKGGVIEYFN